MIDQQIHDVYGGRIRVRVVALIFDEIATEDTKKPSLLLIKSKGLYGEDHFWSPPGGGLDFGETLEQGVKREVLEETGLEIEVTKLVYVSEFVNVPLHAVEFYFVCRPIGGTLGIGNDPELTDQVMLEVAYIPVDKLSQHRIYPHFIPKELPQDLFSGFSESIRYFSAGK
jgi:8-oxo-dGTP diphosphatase